MQEAFTKSIVQRAEEYDHSFWFAVKVSFIGSIGGFLFGYDLGVISGALPLIQDEYDLSSAQQELVVGTMALGSLAGSFIGGSICDYFGRIRSILVCCIIFAVGGVIISFANSVLLIYIGRIIVGIGVSVSAIVDVSYLTEISPDRYRGAVVSCNELMITIGFLASYVFNSILNDYRNGWRLMFFIPVPISFIWASVIFLMPESPRWLLLKGDIQKAYESYHVIYGSLQEAQAAVDISTEQIAKSSQDIFSSKMLYTWRYQLCVSVFLMIAQQLCGNAVILTYMPEISESYGVSDDVSREYLTVIYGVVKVVATTMALICVDRYGRLILLLIGIFLMSVGWFGVSVSILFNIPVIAELGAGLVVAAYSMSFGCVSWIIISEIFPDVFRSRAVGYSMALNWLSNFAVVTSFLSAIEIFGALWVYIFFLLFCIVFFWLVYKFIPDTRSLDCSEIDIALRRRTDGCCLDHYNQESS